ncbi:hypothetical protein SAMN05192529_1446 [Arachidicoccus rhizosphaerae]|uniref:Uncharacterized protein n=1 Tax=Arachidicoccus rhizosphaerae TaxID=551991 RepID=A0A1H4D459_9BACT|nr:hypothetical protein SAMN05192529_1446 [Arachidicoccus rhizosphaerae]
MQSVTFQGADAVQVFKQWQQMGRSEGRDDKTDGDQDGDDDKKKKKYPPPQYTISEHHPGFWEQLRDKNNIVSKFLYSMFDDVYVAAQTFRNRDEKQHLGGGRVTPNDAVAGIAGTALMCFCLSGRRLLKENELSR